MLRRRFAPPRNDKYREGVEMRIGFGYDIHPLKKGRRLRLGGVDIPFSKGLAGHSDGDALFHAIVDAALGAMGEEDIGEHFKDTDKCTRNAPSALFAKKVRQLLKSKHLKIAHIDSTILAESPKLSDFKKRMKEKISSEFLVPVSRVGVKAKTNEGFGDVGKNKAIACFAVVSLKGS